MRYALHTIDNELEYLPYKVNKEDVSNYKQLANKGIYQCPDCKANLIVKYGEERGMYFSHLHSEACMESKQTDRALTRYNKQNQRETKKHRAIIDIVYDELNAQSKINRHLSVEFGFRAKPNFKVIPDILLTIDQKEIALSFITKVNPSKDESLAKEIIKRHHYFIEQNLFPIWLIERKELAIEKEKNSIVLWEAEHTIASYTSEDREWEILSKELCPNPNFFKLYNYPLSTRLNKLETGSLYYLYDENDKIIVNIKRFLKDHNNRPYRAFLLHEGYSLSLADALSVTPENKLLLCDPHQELSNRKTFLDNHLELQKLEEERVQKVRKKEEDRKKSIKQTTPSILISTSKNKKINSSKKTKMSNDLLYDLLRVRIKINSQEKILIQDYLEETGMEPLEIWGIVELYKCKSYKELENRLIGKKVID